MGVVTNQKNKNVSCVGRTLCTCVRACVRARDGPCARGCVGRYNLEPSAAVAVEFYSKAML